MMVKFGVEESASSMQRLSTAARNTLERPLSNLNPGVCPAVNPVVNEVDRGSDGSRTTSQCSSDDERLHAGIIFDFETQVHLQT